MITTKEFKEFLLKNCVNEDGNIEICYIDLSDFEGRVMLVGWKVKDTIILDKIEANIISNCWQIARETIDNLEQVANQQIINDGQRARTICNDSQKAREAILNDGQVSDIILNSHQKAFKYIVNTEEKR